MSSVEGLIIELMATWLTGAVLYIALPKPSSALGQARYLLAPVLGLAFTVSLLMQVDQSTSIAWPWFTIGHYQLDLTIHFNINTQVLLLLVSIISLLVHVYSIGYMNKEVSQPRFFATLALFTFSMLGLTLSDNLLMLFMFWELVGVCSYLLIGFYRSSPAAVHASSKALLMNKIGDAGFLLGIAAVWALTGTLNITSLHSLSSWPYATALGCAFLIAAFAKSAQFPFHTWLPDAMAGPTPVSALIHSATMVAAGVFLLVRIQFLFTAETMMIAAIIGALTALIGGLNAIRENDLKRFLAWSTLSQLGLMVMVAGSSAFDAAFVHLLAHAVFKSGLFLLAGIIIQQFHTQYMHHPIAVSWLVRISMFILAFALMGMPLTIGYYSKEAMLGGTGTSWISILFYSNSFITAFYSARLLMFLTSDNKPASIPITMIGSVVILSAASLWFFYDWSPLAIPALFASWSIHAPNNSLAITNLGVAFFGMAASVTFHRQQKFESIQKLIPVLAHDAWLRNLVVKPVHALAQFTTVCDRQLDRCLHFTVYTHVFTAKLTAWFDWFFIDGAVRALAWCTKQTGQIMRQLVTGRIQDYIWWTVLAVIMLILILAY
jgi:NADH-quinone oxidoreductase subunit L